MSYLLPHIPHPLISVQSIFPLAISRFIVRNQTVSVPTCRTKLQKTSKQPQRTTKRALAPVPGGPNETTNGAGVLLSRLHTI